jgi:NarL family two-component system response regulator YdfI
MAKYSDTVYHACKGKQIMKKITILLADDHFVFREGLRILLEMEDDFDVVGEAVNGLQAVKFARELCPAVVIMDLSMPKLNGLEASRQILQQVAPPKILILSAYGDDAYIKQAAALGLAGYLLKQTSPEYLGKAIRKILKGKRFYSPSTDEHLHEKKILDIHLR